MTSRHMQERKRQRLLRHGTSAHWLWVIETLRSIGIEEHDSKLIDAHRRLEECRAKEGATRS
jgi:hypothetical protein